MERRPAFPDPHEIPAPPGAEGWEEMYPRHWLFGQGREEEEDRKIYFQMSLQAPYVFTPMDFWFGVSGLGHAHGYANACLAIPTVYGIEGRILNGYLYGSQPHEIEDPEIVRERAAIFQERMSFIIENFDEIWRKWVERNLNLASEIESIRWPELRLVEDWDTGSPRAHILGREYSPSGLALIRFWNKLKNIMWERAFLHFDLLDVAQSGFMIFRDAMRKAFPEIKEEELAAMLYTPEQPILEGDFKLRELAEFAVEIGADEQILRDLPPEEMLEELGRSDSGRKWLERWEEAKHWLHLTNGNAMYPSRTISWLDDLQIPFKFLRDYIREVRSGRKVRITREERERKASEAERLFSSFLDLIPSEEERSALRRVWEGARKVIVPMEGHAYYNDQWIVGAASRKLRELGGYLVKYGIFERADDIWYLSPFEFEEILWMLVAFWYDQYPAAVKPWRETIERRRRIIEVLERWTPPPFLVGKYAKPPERITEPLFVVLWGLTEEVLASLVSPPEKPAELRGWAASPGVCEGVARVVRDPINEADRIKEGDILVVPFLTPSQTVVFSKIRGLVTDSGGVMSHPAIVAREYGLPAVVGTGMATSILRDGMRIRVDGSKGTVQLLE